MRNTGTRRTIRTPGACRHVGYAGKRPDFEARKEAGHQAFEARKEAGREAFEARHHPAAGGPNASPPQDAAQLPADAGEMQQFAFRLQAIEGRQQQIARHAPHHRGRGGFDGCQRKALWNLQHHANTGEREAVRGEYDRL